MTSIQNESAHAKTSIGTISLTDTVKVQIMPGVSAPTILVITTERQHVRDTAERDQVHALHLQAVKQAQNLLNDLYKEG